MKHQEKKVAYIIGNHFETLTQLKNVYTINHFLLSILKDHLPKHRLWIVGQGLNEREKGLLNFCKKYHPEIFFYQHKKTHIITCKNLFSKISRMFSTIIQRLGVSR